MLSVETAIGGCSWSLRSRLQVNARSPLGNPTLMRISSAPVSRSVAASAGRRVVPLLTLAGVAVLQLILYCGSSSKQPLKVVCRSAPQVREQHRSQLSVDDRQHRSCYVRLHQKSRKIRLPEKTRPHRCLSRYSMFATIPAWQVNSTISGTGSRDCKPVSMPFSQSILEIASQWLRIDHLEVQRAYEGAIGCIGYLLGIKRAGALWVERDWKV